VVVLNWGDIIAAIPHVDEPDALSKAKSDRALHTAMNWSRPPNWHGTGASHDLLALAQEEALPLAWVPPAEIIRRLRSAGSAESREAVLLEERAVILDACAAAIGECDEPEISDSRFFVGKAIASLRDGHDEAAMALAVSVGDGLAHWAVEVSSPRWFESRDEAKQWDAYWKKTEKYGKSSRIKRVTMEAEKRGFGWWNFRQQVLIAPIPHFFKGFEPGVPKPRHVSRHVVAHEPTRDHMTPVNAIKSVMLVTGIIRSQQDWITDTREFEDVY
jgi:hypothetical protein